MKLIRQENLWSQFEHTQGSSSCKSGPMWTVIYYTRCALHPVYIYIHIRKVWSSRISQFYLCLTRVYKTRIDINQSETEKHNICFWYRRSCTNYDYIMIPLLIIQPWTNERVSIQLILLMFKNTTDKSHALLEDII